MIWLLYDEYVNRSIKNVKFIKHFSWHFWLVLLILYIIDILLFFVNNHAGYLSILIFIFILASSYIGIEIRRIMLKRVWANKDDYYKNIEILKEILVRRKLYEKDKLEIIIKQIEEELPKLKVSEQVFRPVTVFMTVIIIPILMLIIKILIDKITNDFLFVSLVILLALLAFSAYFMIKPLLEKILDLDYERMSNLKKMIQDIRILDFS